MTTQKQQLATATIDWLSGFDPYCATTIHFLDAPTPSQLTDAGRARHIDWIKSEIGKLALRLDQAFCSTPHVGSRVAKPDRFDAVCVIEKIGIAAHVHMAWLPSLSSPTRMIPLEKLVRIAAILETFNRGTRPLEDNDHLLLNGVRRLCVGFEQDAVADWKAKGWSVFSRSTNGPDWMRYILKEMHFVGDFSDQVFFLSDFHSGQQRTKPTRYYSIDPHTGARHYGLDGGLAVKR